MQDLSVSYGEGSIFKRTTIATANTVAKELQIRGSARKNFPLPQPFEFVLPCRVHRASAGKDDTVLHFRRRERVSIDPIVISDALSLSFRVYIPYS